MHKQLIREARIKFAFFAFRASYLQLGVGGYAGATREICDGENC